MHLPINPNTAKVDDTIRLCVAASHANGLLPLNTNAAETAAATTANTAAINKYWHICTRVDYWFLRLTQRQMEIQKSQEQLRANIQRELEGDPESKSLYLSGVKGLARAAGPTRIKPLNSSSDPFVTMRPNSILMQATDAIARTAKKPTTPHEIEAQPVIPPAPESMSTMKMIMTGLTLLIMFGGAGYLLYGALKSKDPRVVPASSIAAADKGAQEMLKIVEEVRKTMN
jgi:hypothetical protein